MLPFCLVALQNFCFQVWKIKMWLVAKNFHRNNLKPISFQLLPEEILKKLTFQAWDLNSSQKLRNLCGGSIVHCKRETRVHIHSQAGTGFRVSRLMPRDLAMRPVRSANAKNNEKSLAMEMARTLISVEICLNVNISLSWFKSYLFIFQIFSSILSNIFSKQHASINQFKNKTLKYVSTSVF